MTDAADTVATLARIEGAQAALRRRLRSVETSRLYERPASGGWSPMEHVRHLIFAEQHHFGPYLERGYRWSKVGVPPPNKTGERRLSPVGSDPDTTVDEVFDAWTKVHEVVRVLATEDPSTVGRTVAGNLQHLTIHAETIEALLRG